jgi:hypothetical protein
VVDQLDLFAEGGGFCEVVDRGTVAGGPGGPAAGGGASLGLKVARSIRWSRLARSGLLVEVQCPAACTVDARLFVAARTARGVGLAKSVKVGRGTKRLSRAGTAKVRVKLTRKARSRLRRARRLSLTLRVKAAGKTVTRKVAVKR